MACNSQVHILHGMYQSDAWDTWPVLVRFMRCKTCTSEILKIHKLYQPCKWHTQTLAARYCKYHTPCTNRVHRMFLSCCQNDVYTWTTCKLQQSQLDCPWLTPNLNTFLNLIGGALSQKSISTKIITTLEGNNTLFQQAIWWI